ncbi:VOC family protein [Verticiella sediminum]|nr:VOC family protein [Verticiella sediminum]
MIKGILGINIAVKDLNAAIARYEAFLGCRAVPSAPGAFAYPGLQGARFDVHGFRLNLISSDDPATSVGRFLAKRGEGVFLVSVQVDDADAQAAEARALGLEVLLDPSARGRYGAVNFVHPRDMHGVQFEMLQPAVAEV